VFASDFLSSVLGLIYFDKESRMPTSSNDTYEEEYIDRRILVYGALEPKTPKLDD